MKRKVFITLLMAFLLVFTSSFSTFAVGEANLKISKADVLRDLSAYMKANPSNIADGPREIKVSDEMHINEVQYNNERGSMVFDTPADNQRYPLNGNMTIQFGTDDLYSLYRTVPVVAFYKNGKFLKYDVGQVAHSGRWTNYRWTHSLKGMACGVYDIVLMGCPGYSNNELVENAADFDVPMISRKFYITPSGKVTIKNTIANSARKTNDVIWDKSKVKGATNYQVAWRARGGKWAYKNVGNTVRGTTSGLTIGNLYEIKVRPYGANNSKAYGAWSNSVYRYFYTTEKIRLASKSKGTFTMSWKHNPLATSYQIMYTTSPNGKGAAQNIKTAGRGATSITIGDIKVGGKKQKLVSGRTYYVQVREIRNYAGVNWIGNISIPVAVKVR